MSNKLQEAREYEEKYEKQIGLQDRPAFHLSTRVGWMNDPNGFSFYNGKYHMFYQYYPYDSNWGPMHWGHAVSTDMLHWEYLPAALAPDETYDSKGCFSGSALELEDGRHLLMYTGVVADEPTGDLQHQCIAIGDGVEYVKYAGNPVIDADMLPAGCNKYDFRDPKIWRNSDGTFSCVIGSRPADGSGQILLYTSSDGLEWKFKSILAENKWRFGTMWECPDFFELDGKWVLLTSPTEMLAKDYEYHNGSGTLCLIGEYDEQSGTFTEQFNQAIEYGIDFYAPQTILTPDGRRVMIGWMQDWGTLNIKDAGIPWFGQMTIPRELSVKNGRLYQKPSLEVDAMRTDKVEYLNKEFDGEIELEGVRGRIADLEVKVRGFGSKSFRRFEIRFAKNDDFYSSIIYEPDEGLLTVDRTYSGLRKAVIHQRSCRVKCVEGEISLRIILDRFSAEVFVNDGEQALTITTFTERSADRISFVADGAVNMDVIKYSLN